MAVTPRLIIFAQPELANNLDQSALTAAGFEIKSISQILDVETWPISNLQDTALIVAHPSAAEGLRYCDELLKIHPLLPIILITSEVNQSALKQALEIGIVDYLSTPVDSATLLKAIEQALIRQKSWLDWHPLKQVFDDLADGFILADFNSNLIMVNRSAREIFQIEEELPAGKPVTEIFYNADLRDIFKPERTYPYRNEISLENGQVYYAQSSLIEDVGIAVLLQEITHLKELDRIKTDFVYTVSHDIRSPLTAIYGFIGLIDRVGPVNHQQGEFIEHIQSSLQHITSLINDLMDLGRVEAGYDLQMEDVNLKDIIKQAMDNLDYQADEKMQEVMLSTPDELPVIPGNPLHLQRMVTNLIENAIKFTPPMGKINVRCRAEACQLILEVSDNGPGIPLADQPHIFDKFYRGSNLARNTSGTGLGLSIVKSIAEKHHGRVWVDSSPQGTTFSVILPVK